MNAEKISKDYIEFIKKNTKFNDITENHTEVITPFVDFFGEAIGFSILINNDKYTITDNGYTTWNLDINGINVSKKGRRHNLMMSLINFNAFNYSKKTKTIYKDVIKKDIGQTIHDMTQLLLNIYDFAQLNQQSVHSQFLEDVKSYFLDNDKYLVFPSFSITGKSRLEHKFNFLFMSKGISKIVRVHNSIDHQQMNNILAGWLDTVNHRKLYYNNKEELYILVSEDGFKKIKSEYISALKEYNINVLDFGDKKSLQFNLAI